MEGIKLEMTQHFREFLLKNNINYRELNLTHFHIFNPAGDLIAQVWPTTEKCVWQEQKPHQTFVGFGMIERKILEAYEGAVNISDIRAEFEKYQDRMQYARKLITVTELPSGALETQINDSALVSKYQYIFDAYDGNMRLKSNPEIQILDFIIV